MRLHPMLRRSTAVFCLAATTGLCWAETQPLPCGAPPSAVAPAAVTPAAPPPPTFVLDDVPSFTRSESYSAQRKPRIAVIDFVDTNQTATSEVFKASVEAMLVTFLKRKSQLVVIERQRLGAIIDEWKLARQGKVKPTAQSAGSRELFEKIDAIVVGSVTLLNAPAGVQVVGKAGGNVQPAGPRIEVDIKALGRSDGRILAAAKSSGPLSCLRSIIDRLGVDLEQALLRPYYGTLQFHLSTPENVRVFLTPILLDEALDEEKPPAERGESVVIEAQRDIVQPWTTNPTSYTIQNLLGGWYTVRLERPGYRSIGIDNDAEDWLARQRGDKVQILYQRRGDTAKPVLLEGAPAERRRFVVHVDSRDVRALDGDKLGYASSWQKTGGSITPLVRREHLDEETTHKPARVILIGKEGLDLNREERVEEYAQDLTCDLFEEKPTRRVEYGRTIVRAGQRFDFESFRGGSLIIEDYQGETVPTGTYRVALWEPNYKPLETTVVVNPDDRRRPLHAALERETLPVQFETTGARKGHQVLLVGRTSSYQVPLSLDFDSLDHRLPVDEYLASTDIPGLRGWSRIVDLLPDDSVAPTYDLQEDERLEREAKRKKREDQKRRLARQQGRQEEEPEDEEAADLLDEESLPKMPVRYAADAKEEPPTLVARVKTRLAVAGRFGALGSASRLTKQDLFADGEIARWLDVALAEEPADPAEETGEQAKRRLLRKTGSVVAQTAIQVAASTLLGETGAAMPSLIQTHSARRQQAGPAVPPDSGKTAPPPTPAEARAQLALRLPDIDLLILDDTDMARLRGTPELAALTELYLAAGGALYAYVSEPGNYGDLVGAPLSLVESGRPTAKFEMVTGEVGLELAADKKAPQVGGKRKLLRPDGTLDGAWKVVAYTAPGRDPRVVERTGERGGYAALWLDRPGLFRTRLLKKRVAGLEEKRSRVETYVLNRMLALAARRYSDTTRQTAAPAPAPVVDQLATEARAEARSAPVAVEAKLPATASSDAGSEDRLRRLEALLQKGLITREEYYRKRIEIVDSL